MWVSTTDLAKHHVVVIAHEQKWVTGNAETITPIVNGTKKGRPARELRRGTPTLRTCRHLLRLST